MRQITSGYRNGVGGGPQLTWVNIIATLALLATVAGGAWLLFQNQFTNLEVQMHTNLTDLSAQIKDNRGQADRLRDHSVQREEHTEFVKRVDERLAEIQRRLDVLEATRPTTGELEKVSGATNASIIDLKERLQFLEQNRQR